MKYFKLLVLWVLGLFSKNPKSIAKNMKRNFKKTDSKKRFLTNVEKRNEWLRSKGYTISSASRNTAPNKKQLTPYQNYLKAIRKHLSKETIKPLRHDYPRNKFGLPYFEMKKLKTIKNEPIQQITSKV